ncbi:CCA tRNA nucleotidyltransferase [[Clostridium] dakarense]|uniref:CCA tRNA nucleotidyltransferase n=1 Tax=Faecalimicrobium dakarense TaxID=1301100 RepID=UPI0004B7B9B0|nr:CCA tRNA nucleotidyltransferase [[Clostridium] dakarense]
MKINLPKKVEFIINKIYENGYEAFIVGGCVRDYILGLEPNDYDITTSATPNEILEIFKDYKTIEIGIKHGTVSVMIDNELYEITTYRLESEYEGNRRPKSVEFTSNIYHDLKRRDFTINAMAYNDKVGLIDKFDGVNDVKRKVIKTVGNPDERFNEDGLRIVRAIRFSAKLGFEIEEDTLKSIYKNANIIKNISIERITDEFNKIILSKNSKKIITLYETKILKYIGMKLDLDEDEKYIFEKELDILSECDKNLEERLVMLEYLIINRSEKELRYEEGKGIINLLRYSKKTTDNCNKLIENMFLDENNIDKIKIKERLRKIGYSNLIKVLKLKRIYYNYILKDDNCKLKEKIKY